VAPDLIASTPTAEWVSGPRTTSEQEKQNIFAEGAAIRITGDVQNIGTADAPKTKAAWRGTKGVTSLTKAADFGKLDPIEEVAALGVKKSITFSRDTPPLPLDQFQFGMCADDDPSASSGQGKVNELDETNNCSPAPLKIAVVPAAGPTGTTPPPPTTSGKPWDGWIKLSGKIKDGKSDYGVRYDFMVSLPNHPNTTRFCLRPSQGA